METGGVRCWGVNVDGQLGDGTNMNRSDPLGAPEILTGVEMIAAGGTQHTLRSSIYGSHSLLGLQFVLAVGRG
jgi:hypothetical protein